MHCEQMGSEKSTIGMMKDEEWKFEMKLIWNY